MKPTDKKLIAFLKEKGAYEQYTRNIEDFCNKDYPYNPNNLDSAFVWVETPENHDYWYHLYCEFQTWEPLPKGVNSYKLHGGELG